MKPLLSAKQLTARYFSIVAIAIIAVHLSVFELTTDDLEYAFVQNRLDNIYASLQSENGNESINTFEDFSLFNEEENITGNRPSLIFNLDQLPTNFPPIDKLSYNRATELGDESSKNDHYMMKVRLEKGDQERDALLVIDNTLYELSEEQLLSTHTKQITITLALTLLSLLVVVQISRKLTLPIAAFSKMLSSKNPADLNLLSVPKEVQTKELKDMVSTFNQYQSQIQALIERERSFNRYASHELRSPLMVMKGAITLLHESNNKAFTDRQLRRLDNATEEMSEFVETLLSLTKPIGLDEKTEILLDEALITRIVENHVHLLKDKPVSWRIRITERASIQMPEAAFHILLGNLIKNAFAYTDEGEVIIELHDQKLRVIDTGKGFDPENEKADGYGLGLLLVRDVSRRFGYAFELNTKNGGGTAATVHLSSHT